MKFNEDSRVKIPTILHLISLGYGYLSLKNCNWNEDTNIFSDIFLKSILNINQNLELEDAQNKGDVVLINASNLGTKIKEGKNQKTVLSETEEQQIIDIFNNKEVMEDFSVVVDYEEIKSKNYSLSAGQYFEVKIEYTDITQDEFKAKMTAFENNLDDLFTQSKELEKEIKQNLKGLSYE
jgi:type I restriction enzyme M protein